MRPQTCAVLCKIKSFFFRNVVSATLPTASPPRPYLGLIPCGTSFRQGIVEAGFDGACPRMRCMCCPRVVCETAWAPLVEPSVLKTFRKRAATLLSIQVKTQSATDTEREN